MSCCGQANAICPCGAFIHPARITNVPGLTSLSYRAGDYTTFREALLRALPGEVSLTSTQPAGADGTPGKVVQLWRPGATGDLAVQMIEWWAYLADILTFYNERIANQAYLGTADQTITVNRLVRLLGYRPKPGIGATGTLAALMSGPTAFTLPPGFQIQSKPGPGQQPQIFELAAATTVGALATGPVTGPQGVASARQAPDPSSRYVTNNVLTLQGTTSAINPGDRLLVVPASDGFSLTPPASASGGFAFKITHGKDPQLGAITSVEFRNDDDLSAVQGMPSPTLYKTNQSVQVWQYTAGAGKVIQPSTPGPTGTQVDLAGIVRGPQAGDYIIFATTGSTASAQAGAIQSTTELVWYANPPGSDPAQAPTSGIAIPIPHTRLVFAPALSGYNDTQASRANVLVWHGWKEVGALVVLPAPSVGGSAAGGAAATTSVRLSPPTGSSFPTVTDDTNVLVEDALGNGAAGTLDASAQLTLSPPVPVLYPPFDVLFNLLAVTRGKTVASEVLGGGNAAIAGQDFVLQKSPVTYLQDPASLSGNGYSSTVRVWVNNVEWSEARYFYGQPANAQVFVTSEDEQGQTHVTFGDGVNGARPPTGAGIVATYRYGSGAAAPAVGSLTMILKPMPGLQAILNPVPLGGGADPDPPNRVRQYAPKSVLALGRAVSVDDYAAIAGAASGVTSALAVVSFNALAQRPQTQVYVIPGAAAASAQSALAAAADPNRIPVVLPAVAIRTRIRATLLLTPTADPAIVQANATAALAGQYTGLFVLDPNSPAPGVYYIGVGQALYNSQIFAALQVAGVAAVADFSFQFHSAAAGRWQLCERQRHDPPPGYYFTLALADLRLLTPPPGSGS